MKCPKCGKVIPFVEPLKIHNTKGFKISIIATCDRDDEEFINLWKDKWKELSEFMFDIAEKHGKECPRKK